jgi:hypothetical protein
MKIGEDGMYLKTWREEVSFMVWQSIEASATAPDSRVRQFPSDCNCQERDRTAPALSLPSDREAVQGTCLSHNR